MEFGVLGPLLVRAEAGVVQLPGPRQRALLAMLLLRANQSVPYDVLVEAVWDGRPPPGAGESLPSYVMRLRRALGAEAGSRVVTRSGGYAIELDDLELDLGRFRNASAQARDRAGAGDWKAVSALLAAALGLWRGEALADVPVQNVLHEELRGLAETRLWARQQRIDADLELGRHHEVIPELQQAIAAHPLHEPLREQLMLALYRAGRQAEALDVYQSIRRTLAEDLGADPTPRLGELHQRILSADPGLAAPGDRPTVPDQAAPHMLPAAVRHFAGRANEIKALTGLIDDAAAPGATVVISAINGTAGIGKTALAVHFAHQVAEQFPGGQLYVNLRGFDPGGPPVAPAEAIRGFLDALGVPPSRIPAGLEARAARYRSLLSGRRVLVLLDNARDAEQVRPLLPGSPECLVVVTSRDQLLSLVAAEGGRPLTLDLLTLAESRELLARRLGNEAVDSQQGLVDELIELCARLPLALNIAAARAAIHPARPLAELVAQLRDARERLDILDGGDAVTDLRAVFFWSYQHLSAPAARMFRLLAVHPGPDISVPAAASLAGIPPGPARRVLDELTGVHLLSEHRPGRFAFHDLLRAYAVEQAHQDERHPAAHRVQDHYLSTAHTAAVRLRPTRDPLLLDPPQPGTVPEDIADREHALAWFQAERPILLALIAQAADTGFDSHAWQIPWCVAEFLDRTGRYDELVATQRTALAAAGRQGDQDEQARAHGNLGRAYAQLGSPQDALAHLSHALDLYQRLADPTGEANTRAALAQVLATQGALREGLEHGLQALSLYQAVGHRVGQAIALNVVGYSYTQLGDHLQALICCEQGLELHREMGNRDGEAATLDSLGFACHQLGRYREAVDSYRQAVSLRHELGHRGPEAGSLTCLGDTQHALGHFEAARDTWRQALAILVELNHPDADQVRAKLRAHE